MAQNGKLTNNANQDIVAGFSINNGYNCGANLQQSLGVGSTMSVMNRNQAKSELGKPKMVPLEKRKDNNKPEKNDYFSINAEPKGTFKDKDRFFYLGEPQTEHNKGFKDETVFMQKSRINFGGGFKVPEIYKQKVANYKKQAKIQSEEDPVRSSDLVTKQQATQKMKLTDSQTVSNIAAHSRKELTDETVKGLDNDFKKLKLQENVYLNNRIKEQPGGERIIELKENPTEQEKARIEDLKQQVIDQDAQIIHVDEKRLQLLRHQPGQLESLKREYFECMYDPEVQGGVVVLEKKEFPWIKQPVQGKKVWDIDELEQERLDTKSKIKFLEQMIFKDPEGQWKNRDAKLTKAIRRKEIREQNEAEELAQKSREFTPIEMSDEENQEQKPAKTPPVQVEQPEIDEFYASYKHKEEKPSWQGSYPFPLPYIKKATIGEDKLTKNKEKKSWGELSTRQQGFMTKYNNFKRIDQAVKTKEKATKWDKKQDFDRFTKSSKSPSVRTMFYKENQNAKSLSPTKFRNLKQLGYFEDLIPSGYEEALMTEALENPSWNDPFKLMGVSKEDKMTFFLMKWIFKACSIKPKEGDAFMTLGEFENQLKQNDKVLHALNNTDMKDKDFLNQIVEQLQEELGEKDRITWDFFCGFFFFDSGLQNTQRTSKPYWWRHVDLEGREVQENSDLSPVKNTQQNGELNQKTRIRFASSIPEVKMTPQLELLLAERRIRTEQEVEQEYIKQIMLAQSGQAQGKLKAQPELVIESPIKGDEPKSELLLLPSQVESIREVYEKLDTQNDQILKRCDFVLKLRLSKPVVDFLNANAVKTADVNPKILTLDEVLCQVEADEMYEQKLGIRGAECSMMFITWREFLTYLEDYKDIEERQARRDRIQNLKKEVLNPKTNTPVIENQEELLKQEIQKRIDELPKLRPADHISVPFEQLLLIKKFFDSQKTGELCATTFFTNYRKSKEIADLLRTIAREPDDESRFPKETFQQVFDRMEKDLYGKNFPFSTVIEYFTRRGRPLTTEELFKMQQEDRAVKEEEAAIRREEEAQGRSPADNKTLADSNQVSNEDDDEEHFAKQHVDSKTGQKYMSKTKTIKRSQSARIKRSEIVDQKFIPLTVPSYQEHVHKKTTIAERKFQAYMATVRSADEVNFVFRRKNPPKNIYDTQLLAKINAANERRRQSVKAQSIALTKEREKPFNFWTRDWAKLEKKQKRARSQWDEEVVYESEDEPQLNAELTKPPFKANPIPKVCSVLTYHESKKKEDDERLKRTKEQAKIKLAQASMPSRMQKAEDRKKDQVASKPRYYEEYTFTPKINPPKTAADFKKKQKAFEEKLIKKKGNFYPTEVKPFNFSQTKTKLVDRDYHDEAKTRVERERNERQMSQTMLYKKAIAEPATQPASTKSTTVLAEKRRQQLEDKKEKIKQQAAEDKRRQEGNAVQREFKREFLTALNCPAPKPSAKTAVTPSYNIQPHPDFHAAKANSIERQQKLQENIQHMQNEAARVKEQLKECVKRGWEQECLIDMNLYEKEAEKELNIAIGKVMRLINVLLKSGLSLKEAETHLAKDSYTKNRERLVAELMNSKGYSELKATELVMKDATKAYLVQRPAYKTDRELRQMGIQEKEWSKHRGMQPDEWTLYKMGVERKLLEVPEDKKKKEKRNH